MIDPTVVLERFGVRKSRKQKEEFRTWLSTWFEEQGYVVTVESGILGRNLVVGDPKSASLLLGAHYDTPARLPFPNLSTPWDKWKGVLCLSPLLILLLLFFTALATLSLFLFGDHPFLADVLYYGVSFLVLFLMMCGPANKHNVNDNTSGVLTLMNIATLLSEDARNRVCFVFFDNEEKGLLGSLSFYTKNGAGRKDKLLFNFDCVSDGDYLCAFASDYLRKNEQGLLNRLVDVFPVTDEKSFSVGKGSYASDSAVFKRSFGFCALNHGKFLGGYLDKIHTGKDTVLDTRNIDLLSDGVVRFVDTLEDENDG